MAKKPACRFANKAIDSVGGFDLNLVEAMERESKIDEIPNPASFRAN
jgi:hypothetical protein